MAVLSVTLGSRAGVSLAGVACASGGDGFANDGQEVAVFVNASGSPITVTIPRTDTVDGRAVAARTVSVGAGATLAIGPFQPGIYNDAGGLVQFTYSGVTTFTVTILKVSPAS